MLRVGFTEPPGSPRALVRSYRTVSPLPVMPGEPDAHHDAQAFRAELGYRLVLHVLELRPTLRVGAAWVTTPRDMDGHFLSPDLGVGVTLLVPIDHAFIGVDVDARALTRLVNNGDNLYSNTTLASYLTAGLRF